MALIFNSENAIISFLGVSLSHGWNEIPDDIWQEALTLEPVKQRVEQGYLKAMTKNSKLIQLSVDAAIDAINYTHSVRQLKEWQLQNSRIQVERAICERIKELKR